MVSAARYAFAILAWAFLVGLVLQVFLIGLALFADESAIQTPSRSAGSCTSCRS